MYGLESGRWGPLVPLWLTIIWQSRQSLKRDDLKDKHSVPQPQNRDSIGRLIGQRYEADPAVRPDNNSAVDQELHSTRTSPVMMTVP